MFVKIFQDSEVNMLQQTINDWLNGLAGKIRNVSITQSQSQDSNSNVLITVCILFENR